MDSNSIFINISNNASPVKNAAQLTIKPFEVTDILKFDREPYVTLSDSRLGMNLIDILRTMYESSCSLVEAMRKDDDEYHTKLVKTLGDRVIQYSDILRFISASDLAEFSKLLTTAILDTAPADINLRRVTRALFESVFKRYVQTQREHHGTYARLIIPSSSVSVSVTLSRVVNVVFDVDLTGLDTFEDRMAKIMNETFARVFDGDDDEVARSILVNLLKTIHKPAYGFADKIYRKMMELEYALYSKEPSPMSVDASLVRPEHASIGLEMLEEFAALRREIDEENSKMSVFGGYSSPAVSFQTPGAPPQPISRTRCRNILFDLVYNEECKMVPNKATVTETAALVSDIVGLIRNFRKFKHPKNFVSKLRSEYMQSNKGIEEFRKCIDTAVDAYKQYCVSLYEKDLPFMQTIL